MELQNIKNQNQFKKIAVACDHRGEDYVRFVKKALDECGIETVFPEYENSADNDYPDVVVETNKLFQSKQVDGMILLCGTGVGMMIAANKCKNVRCVWANEEDVAAFGRIHENCNALALGVGYEDATIQRKVHLCKRKLQRIVKTFVTTPFGGGRHQRRVEKLNNIK